MASNKKSIYLKNKSSKKKRILTNKSLDETNISKIIFDSKYNFDKEDPLLIGPICDIDFVASYGHSNGKNTPVSKWINQYSIDDIYEDYFPLISE